MAVEASKIVCAIPARFGSTRLPGKPLLPLAGKPLIQHTFERVAAAEGVGEVVVLTDDERIQRAVEAFGGMCEMTPEECATGTDRIAWAAQRWEHDVILNVQGDEPMIEPELVTSLATHLASSDDAMATMATPASSDDMTDPHAVKVVCDRSGYALYFSRSQVPYERSESRTARLRHLGIYAYRRETLLELSALEPTPLETAEGLEQLRALENGIAIRVLRTENAPIGVDTQADLDHVETLLNPPRRD